MKINIILLAAVIILAGLWTYWDQQKQTPSMSTPAYADFEFKALDDKKHTFYDYKNKIVFAHFWATWCMPCLKELPELVELATNHPEKIVILAFAVADQPEKIKTFLSNTKQLPPNFVIGLDSNKEISEKHFGTNRLPETFILTPSLILYDKKIGAQNDWRDPKWKEYIHNL